ncbi:MAG: hypothetical protein HY906_16105 [Deltaproteobacteria bacterium]|nr:hypothetical protein [Deltaproteobacteria bacterium]
MPSYLHTGLLVPFQHRPALAAELLRGVFHLPLPSARVARIDDAAVSRVIPTEHRPDLVVVLGRRAPRYGIVLEVQLARSSHKAYVWPLYHAALRTRLRAPVALLVLTPHAPVAVWARATIQTGQPGGGFAPLALGPKDLPRVTDLEQACGAPQLALLSALVHGQAPDGRDVVITALRAAAGSRLLDTARASQYHTLVLGALPEEQRREVEAAMASAPDPHYVSEFSRRIIQSHIEGKAEGKAEGLLAVLAARGLAVTAPERARVLRCDDPATLDAWIAAAVTAASVAEVLAPIPRRRPALSPRVRRRTARPLRARRRRPS